MKALNDIMPSLETLISETKKIESDKTEKCAAIGRQFLELPEMKKALVDLENCNEKIGAYSLDYDGLKFSVLLPNIFPHNMEKSTKNAALECLRIAISDDGSYYLDVKEEVIYMYFGPCITINWDASRRETFIYDFETEKAILEKRPSIEGSEKVSEKAYIAALICFHQDKNGIYNSVVQTYYDGSFHKFFDLLEPLKEYGVKSLDDAAGIQSVIDLWNETSEEN